MSDVKGRAREALTGITQGNWEVRNRGEQPDPTVTAASVHSGHRSILFSKDGFSYGYADRADAEFIAAAPSLISDLLSLVEEHEAEIARLRNAGPWVEHIERMEAMKRHRDGECICDCNPETTGGPDEFCPWHGRPYQYLVEGLDLQAAEIAKLKGEL